MIIYMNGMNNILRTRRDSGFCFCLGHFLFFAHSPTHSFPLGLFFYPFITYTICDCKLESALSVPLNKVLGVSGLGFRIFQASCLQELCRDLFLGLLSFFFLPHIIFSADPVSLLLYFLVRSIFGLILLFLFYIEDTIYSIAFSF